MTYFTSPRPPTQEQLPAVRVRLDPWMSRPEMDPVGVIRQRTVRMPYLHRTFLLGAIRDLEECGGELHWTQVWRGHNYFLRSLHPNRKPLSRAKFWDWMWPAAVAGVVEVLVDDDWPRRD